MCDKTTVRGARKEKRKKSFSDVTLFPPPVFTSFFFLGNKKKLWLLCIPTDRWRKQFPPMALLRLMSLWKMQSGRKYSITSTCTRIRSDCVHTFRREHGSECGMNTLGRLYDDCLRLIFFHAHREANVLAGELSEESDLCHSRFTIKLFWGYWLIW